MLQRKSFVVLCLDLNTGHERCCIAQWNIFELFGGIVLKEALRLFFIIPSILIRSFHKCCSQKDKNTTVIALYCKTGLIMKCWRFSGLHTICVVHLLTFYLTLRQKQIVDANVGAFLRCTSVGFKCVLNLESQLFVKCMVRSFCLTVMVPS